MGAREFHPDPRAPQPLDRLQVKTLSSLAFAQQRPRARLDPERPVGATGRGRLQKRAEGIGRELELAAAGARLGDLGKADRDDRRLGAR
jgi:hypothetical protein